MFSRRASRPVRWMRAALAVVVSCAVVAAGGTPVAAADPERPDDAQPWQVAPMKSVPGEKAPVRPRRADPAAQRALRAAPKVAWPKPGKAAVTLPQQASRAAGDKGVRAGTLPVWVAPPTRAAARGTAAVPATVAVEVLGRRDDRLLLRMNRGDGVAAAGPVSLRVDYSSFRHAYGGDWATRLRVVQLPDCALGTPQATECAGTAVPTVNDGSGALTADVAVAGDATLFAVQAAASSGAGSFRASSLSPSGSWSVGGSSGDFNWSYPMDSPPSLGGPQPDLGLEYSSGSVDGRTSATNNQPSWAGEGFEFEPGGAIERRYKACADDLNGNNGTRKTGDLCWGTDNAYLSLNGKGGELVRDDATGTWRLRNDDRSKVERLTGASNGDNDGEYWRITTTDGTQYYFGLNRLTGWVAGNAETKSTWTVPVFGNHSGEPCRASTFAASHCKQAYQWNLDYVVDRHGNTMSFFYATESNYYARNLTATTVSSYVRSGNLVRIEYGQRDGTVYTAPAVARVLFTTAERCIPGSACVTSQPATYPDTPLDLACASSTNCNNKFNPTFWTQKRLAKVTSQVWRGSAFADVESWTLRHTFPDPGDGTRPGMWLEAVTHAGHVGGTATTPEVNFDGIQLANRLDGIDGIPPMNWWRVSAVHYGTGGELAVTYSGRDCTSLADVPAPDTNGRRCHPVKWTPEGQTERQDWFHKYVVTEVTESDRVSGLEPVTTQIEYLTPPAWRFDEEDGLVDTKYKTWSQWRGYGRTRVKKGNPAAGPQSIVEYTYWRGMDGDRTASGGRKTVTVTDSTGTAVPDTNVLAGQVREEAKLLNGTVVEKTISDQWISAATSTRVRSWGTTQTFQVEDGAVRQSQLVADGWQNTSTVHTYDASGTLLSQNDLNDVANPNDDVCTRFEYASNPGAGITEFPAREHVVSVGCDKAWTNGHVISDTRTYYDGSSTPGGTPVRGDVTKQDELSGFDTNGNPTYVTTFTATYDAIGRVLTADDARGKRSTAVYTPSGAAPLTRTVVTEPGGHATTTDLEPAWGEEVSVVDPAGRRTDATYDPLGRTRKVWLPGRSKASDTPNFEYTYLLRGDGPSVVSTKTLQANGSYETTHELSDGLLRPRQLQEPAPGGGRMVTDVYYDSRGLEVKENAPYYNDAPPGTDILVPNDAAVPTQKVTVYDGAELPTTEIFKSAGVEKWRTLYSHAGDRTTIDPPAGEEASTRIHDSQGRLVELRQYTSGSPTGSYDRTTYTYTARNELAAVTDPAGNTWRFSYDVRGRKIREEDPDQGVTTYTFDDLDQLTTSTDSRGVTLAYAYDDLGRPTAIHDGSLTGPKRVEWVYDTFGKGLLTSATRYVGGQPYTTRVTGYDDAGRPLGIAVVIPESEGPLAGTYTVNATYNADGEVASRSLPGVGGLPAETLRYGYDNQDLPTTLTGFSSYVVGTEYTPLGEPSVITMKTDSGKWLQHKYEYEAGTRRLSRVVTERETLPRQIANTTYRYDPSGNVTRINDTPDPATGEAPDTQCFTYDHLQRLTGAWTPASGDCAAAPSAGTLGGPEPYWHKWTFDKIGNRTSETRTTASGTTTSTYEYPAAGQRQPHALQQVTTTGPAGTKVDSYGYDQDGNTTSRNLGGTAETLTWDAEGKLTKVAKAGEETSFVYDAEGARLIRRDASGTTLYLGDTEVLLTPGGQVVGTRYYEHGGQVVAVRSGGRLHWLGTDHHGTVDLAVDEATQQVQRRRTTPYGTPRTTASETWPGQKSFVGGTSDPSTGLVHLDAREYDPATGRFISVDPVADYEDPQQLHGYAYGNNNPVSFSDPDGQVAFAIIPVVIFVIRMVPIMVRVARYVPTIVRTVTPVLRPIVSRGWSFLRGLVSKVVGWVKSFVVSFKTVIKKIMTWKKTTKPVRTKVVKKVKVKRVQKKPAAKHKRVVKKKVRNTRVAKKPSKRPAVEKMKQSRSYKKTQRWVKRERKKEQKRSAERQQKSQVERGKGYKRKLDTRQGPQSRVEGNWRNRDLQQELKQERWLKENARNDIGDPVEPPRTLDPDDFIPERPKDRRKMIWYLIARAIKFIDDLPTP